MRLPLILCTTLLAGPAMADDFFCEQAWFVRNLAMDRAGHCFASPLGQALFDNTDCRTETDVSAEIAALVEEIRAEEAQESCNIDTSRTRLDWEGYFNFYRLLQDLPVPTPYESGCVGYLGEPVAVRSGREDGAPVTGRILPGDSVGFNHVPRDGWEFATVSSPNDPLAGSWGWIRTGTEPLRCEMYAG